MSLFDPYGPFEIPTADDGILKEREPEFWDTIEECESGLSNAVGCYIFGIRAGLGIRPWYVGKTEKAGFKKEVFQYHKRYVLWDLLRKRDKGTALIYFLAKRTPLGRFAKPSTNGHAEIATLEELLINTCILRNPHLQNKAQTKHYKTIQVPGYMNDPAGRPTKSSKDLARLLGLANIHQRKRIVQTSIQIDTTVTQPPA